MGFVNHSVASKLLRDSYMSDKLKRDLYDRAENKQRNRFRSAQGASLPKLEFRGIGGISGNAAGSNCRGA